MALVARPREILWLKGLATYPTGALAARWFSKFRFPFLTRNKNKKKKHVKKKTRKTNYSIESGERDRKKIQRWVEREELAEIRHQGEIYHQKKKPRLWEKNKTV